MSSMKILWLLSHNPMLEEFYLKALVPPSLPLSLKRLVLTVWNSLDRISLIAGIYKILAKVHESRLHNVLPSNISSSQGAFVQDRQILMGSSLPTSLCRHWNKESGLICKLDLERAFDRVDWSFLSCFLGWASTPSWGDGSKSVYLLLLSPSSSIDL